MVGLVAQAHDFLSQRKAAFAALGPHFAQADVDAQLAALALDEVELGLGVGRERVDGDDAGETVDVLHVVDVLEEVGQALFKRFEVLTVELGLGHAAVILERADGRNQYDAVRSQTGLAALDVHEFLCAEVSAEACLCDGNITQLECQLGCLHAVAAVRDIGERTAVHQTGRALERLNQVGLDGILHQCRHGALCMQVAGVDRLAGVAVCHQNITETLFQVVQISSQTQDSHNLGCYGDHEVVLARHAVHLAGRPLAPTAPDHPDYLALQVLVGRLQHAANRDIPIGSM